MPGNKYGPWPGLPIDGTAKPMLTWYPFIFFFVSNSKEIPIYPPGS